ncbi:hypothetical protein P152DRAFT_397058 [Eremomyces bilateralis CBS 781.70]|uniref:Vacuolar protein sorting-associated protein 51 homolog n=1 Tax=Eremomyces bilateralis CBS 781.70 TaxID=1392243 RepID=A0A6G1G3X7_9PEZI|nr:uncharacterized protein P152DRAFT_397058 [Eremomyces bilateralis CBS 781.70]KAF1812620.1 hypothetical protein P152DRAFT_397058 [Eremomyces bilateralis CBS 781.70]
MSNPQDASPRASSSQPASSRTSTDTLSASGPAPRAPTTRRNRAALRDYYKIKPSESPLKNGTDQANRDGGPDDEESELDRPGFDSEKYVKDLLETKGLQDILRVEAGLLSAEIRGLDGERKALVYDNYSKLIAATDTILKMRTNMDPMTPATSTLSPAISHIAETASTLSNNLRSRAGQHQRDAAGGDTQPSEKEMQRQTVQWALDTPRRLRQFQEQGDIDAAAADWDEIQALLDNWTGVQGVEELRAECVSILEAKT